jgi:DNA-binding MarR family transcriptional regulator
MSNNSETKLFAMQIARAITYPTMEKSQATADADVAPLEAAAAPDDQTDRADRGKLKDLLGYHLRRAEVFTFQDFTAALAADGISPGQLGVLFMVQANAGINQTRVGKALGIDRSTLVSIIDSLEGRGLVARNPSPTDRRSHALALTTKGGRFLEDLAPRLAAHEASLARNLSAAERRSLIDLLRRVVEP